jgi:DNA sulfur modification protein DndD
MIINNLSLCDFRTFRGQHQFELSPRIKHGHRRPIVLFGGLNGSGKTSLLTAVQLGLYGRQSLNPVPSHKAYEKFLDDCIHRSPTSIVQSASSWIELSFSYSRDAEVHSYGVRRSWNRTPKGIEEYLAIEQDGEVLREFSREQCQTFLNELIPIGLSELFFFDGEKVADLAEDQTGKVLQHAFRKLMGLDTLDHLSRDLATLIRKTTSIQRPQDQQARLKQLEEQQLHLATETENTTTAIDELRKQLVDIEAKIAQVKQSLEEAGGTWAQSRKEDEIKQAELEESQRNVEEQVRQLFGGILPLAIVHEKITSLVDKLATIHSSHRHIELRNDLIERIGRLRAQLTNKSNNAKLESAIADSFGDLLTETESTASGVLNEIELTTQQLEKLRYWTTQSIPDATALLTSHRKKLKKMKSDWESLESRLRRAPESNKILTADFNLLAELANKRGDLRRQIAQNLELKRKLIRQSIDLVRDLRNFSKERESNKRDSQVVEYGAAARGLLKDFVYQSTARRIRELEVNFAQSLQRLVRKKDMIRAAKIDPETLKVTLLDRNNNQLDKSELSAGERQMYALAILEAMTKTSGRKLPIIIDTPLGRLDSKHRDRLAKNYFPSASHQVVILSTDTEVDETFIQKLSPEISHVYELIYDDTEQCTQAEYGYFWKWEHNERAA